MSAGIHATQLYQVKLENILSKRMIQFQDSMMLLPIQLFESTEKFTIYKEFILFYLCVLHTNLDWKMLYYNNIS